MNWMRRILPAAVAYEFPDNVEWACRIALGTLVAALLQLWPVTRPLLLVPFFVPVLAIVAVGRTVGQTLQACFDIAFASVWSCVIAGALLAAFGRNAIVVTVLLFFTTCLHAYVFTTPTPRKIALALNAVVLLAMATNPENTLVFPFKFLLVVVAALAAAIVAMLLPYPRFALRSAQERMHRCMLMQADLFELQLLTFLCVSEEQASLLQVEGSYMLRALETNRMRVQQALQEAAWEPRLLYRRGLPLQRLYALSAVQEAVTKRCGVRASGCPASLNNAHACTHARPRAHSPPLRAAWRACARACVSCSTHPCTQSLLLHCGPHSWGWALLLALAWRRCPAKCWISQARAAALWRSAASPATHAALLPGHPAARARVQS